MPMATKSGRVLPYLGRLVSITQPAFICPNLILKTIEQSVKSVQSSQ